MKKKKKKKYSQNCWKWRECLQLMKGLSGGWYQKAEISLGTFIALHTTALLC